jgi:ankyrin repeat protein
VDGINVERLCEAARAGDVASVRAMLRVRPELVHLDLAEDDEHRALHYAVLYRYGEIVRLLMQYGADPRRGIWPHRDATSPLTIATERGYGEIVEIIRDHERSRTRVPVPVSDLPIPADLVDAFRRGDQEGAIASLGAHPDFIQAADPQHGMTALHWAAANLWERLGAWLLERGANVNAGTVTGLTPLDLVGFGCDARTPDRSHLVTRFAELLLARGAERTDRWAIASGDETWLRARHGDGVLESQRGLLGHAVRSDSPEMLRLLLDLGLDPNERKRVEGLEEVVYSWGEPLRRCAIAGQTGMAEILLQHGADPNTNVYAASSAMSEAYEREDWAMVRVLEGYGGLVNATTAGYLGLKDRATKLLEDEAAGRLVEGSVPPGGSVANVLLEGAADGGHVEIVRAALERLDWPVGDARWHWMLMRPFGRHSEADRERFLTCFRLIVDRSGADLPGRCGRTLLHDVAADWPINAPMSADERIAFATILLNKGARLDVRDDLLKSTPLGWACRWGCIEFVNLFLQRGADPVEADAESWATPRAWAQAKGHPGILTLLESPRAC